MDSLPALISMGEPQAEIAGTIVLLIMVAVAVGMFIREAFGVTHLWAFGN